MATIVVMDDEQAVRDIVVRMLEMKDHTVMAFSDARPALDSVNFDEVDLVITDLQMPTPGEEAIQVLRSRGSRVPVIVMSGYLGERSVDGLAALGAQAFLMKPFKISSFLQVVQTWT